MKSDVTKTGRVNREALLPSEVIGNSLSTHLEGERVRDPLTFDQQIVGSIPATWRKAAHSGSLKALSKKRGRKPERNPLDEKVRKLERRNARLENELRKAHLIIDVQGKVAGLLGISLDDGTNS